MNLRRVLKLLHTLGAIGMAGGIASFMIMLDAGPAPGATPEYLALREGLYAVSRGLILPSMALVFLSGVLAMAVHFPYQNALWVWLKLAGGFLILESLLATVDAPARKAAAAAAQAVAGTTSEADMLLVINDRWGAWWVLLILAAINVLLSIWRPRFRSRN